MLDDVLLDRIARSGPMPFDEFMALALYDPDGGYFTSGPLRSELSGDFLTSPEVSPLFGETLGRFVAAEAARLGSAVVDLVEAGAGSGSLLRPLLDHLAAVGVSARPVAIEVSEAARRRLGAAVPEAAPASGLDAIAPGLCGVVIANEVLDNLPAAVAVRRSGGWVERFVGSSGESLSYVEVGARPVVAAWADLHAGPVPDGGVVEVQLAAGEWLRRALGLVESGSVVVIDYGDDAEGLAVRRVEGTVRTYRGHHLGPDPLHEPGATDITLDVDFGALRKVAEQVGAAVTVTTQRDFLADWGLGERLLALREHELALARDGDPIQRLEARHLLTGGEALLHPRGLGDFRVLVARR
jgi:SAM-dependent MidA family methyltransferase